MKKIILVHINNLNDTYTGIHDDKKYTQRIKHTILQLMNDTSKKKFNVQWIKVDNYLYKFYDGNIIITKVE